jgi:hypothetical protein
MWGSVDAHRWAGVMVGLSLAGVAHAEGSEPTRVEYGAGPASRFAQWVLASGDNGGLPFIIVDKEDAEILVYDAGGHFMGEGAALLGLARGDESAPGVGDKALSAIRPAERTTPAGRFVASYGPAYGQQRALWIDYATAVSLHPVITSNPKERRPQRLQTPSAEDNRITYGCINVSSSFYREVVTEALRERGIVYVLPETLPLEAVFPAYQLWAQSRPASLDSGSPAARDQVGEVATDAAAVR